jgi:hypothetical protein
VWIIEACEDRDLSGAVRKRALVVTVLPAGLWADELLRVDVGQQKQKSSSACGALDPDGSDCLSGLRW